MPTAGRGAGCGPLPTHREMNLEISVTKYSRLWSLLFSVGFALMVGHKFVPHAPNWIVDVGGFFLMAGLIVSLIDRIADRREREAKQRTEKG
jgi:membrane protein implicated in regulation of membrane protease activity